MSRRIPLILTACLALAGCDLINKQEAQYDDSRNPYYKQAQQDLDNNNATAAASDYESALGANPKLAGAHYQLGIIYGEKLQDPVGSIFHFQQYLKLQPNSDQADKVKALIDKQSQAFAASLPNSPTQTADQYAQLQDENATLKKQVDDAARTIAQLQAQLGKHHHQGMATAAMTPPIPAPAPAAPTTPPLVADNAPSGPATGADTPVPASTPDSTNASAAAPPRALPLDAPYTNTTAETPPGTPGAPTPNGAPSRTYTVVKGDSLWKIAHKMYPGDTKNGVDKIAEANKDAIGGKPLKIGQVLIIP